VPTQIIHISDLHIQNEDSDENRHLLLIVRKIIAEYQKEVSFTAVLITGDMVDDGDERQYKRARQILDPLYSVGFRVFAIPGNHDYGKDGVCAEAGRFEFFKSSFLNPADPASCTFPQMARFGDHFLVGLNSMQAECGFWDGLLADGELGETQINDTAVLLDALLERPSSQKVILYLHHHPFLITDDGFIGFIRNVYERIGHSLKDGEMFMESLRGKVDLLLFGHEHRHLDFSGTRVSAQYGIPIILSAGRCTSVRKEYRVKEDGRIDKETVLNEGMLGRLIRIEDNGDVSFKTLVF
jgi:3',5'-cyclic AMP phosphodiesterase CpdA